MKIILRETRERLGVTQDDLEERSDIHRTTISRIERDVGSTSVATLTILARALGVPVTELFADGPKVAA